MPRPADTPITEDEYGAEVHESWLLIGASRISSSPAAHLFDSEIGHQHFIRVSVTRASRKRDLNRDWMHPRETLLEFDLSEAQWGAFVSSFGVGIGVPATLSHLAGVGLVPQAPFTPRLAESHAEVKEAGTRAVEKLEAAVAAVREAFDGNLGKRELRDRLQKLEWAVGSVPGNMEFAAKSLTEHVENVVTKARADIEGMALRAQQAGVALAPGQTTLELAAVGEEE